MTERTIEMHWQCGACNAKNLGRFMVCQQCGDPKDAREQYEMPSDTAAAQTVTDPALLRAASAGENWRCVYCHSHQRSLHGTCAQCGAAPPPPGPVKLGPALWGVEPQRVRRQQPAVKVGWPVVSGLFAFCALVLLGSIAMQSRPRRVVAVAPTPDPPPAVEVTVTAKVTAIAWARSVRFEELKPVDHEGFSAARPADAFAIQELGTHQHHTERVDDGTTTENYQEREADGTTRTSYTERVQCGQDCTTTAPVCRQNCTSGKNGFATCTTNCSGGGRNCSPRYCNETRYREEPRYRMVTKTRQVRKYRQEPVMRPWSRYKLKEWILVSQVDSQGDALPPSWPKLDPAWKSKARLTETEESPRALDAAHRLVLVRTAKVTLNSTTARGALTLEATEDELRGKYTKDTAHPALALNGVLTRLAPSD